MADAVRRFGVSADVCVNFCARIGRLSVRFEGVLDGFEAALARGHGPAAPAFVLLAAYALLLGVGFSLHEPWRDETHAWLLARDMSVPELWRNAGTEGHPIGWHLLLKMLSLSGLPFEAVRVLNASLAAGAAWIVARYAPFRMAVRGAILLSPPFVYFGIVARSYSLMLLLVTGIAALHGFRRARPTAYLLLLGLLANVMVLFQPFALSLAVLLVLDSRRTGGGKGGLPVGAGLVLFAVLFCAALIQIVPPGDVVDARLSMRVTHFFQTLFTAGPLRPDYYYVLFYVFAAAWLVAALRADRSLGLSAWASLIFFQFVHMFVYGLYKWHCFAAFSVVLGCTWMLVAGDGGGRRGGATVRMVFVVWLLFSLGESGRYLVNDARYPSSNTPRAVEYVREKLVGRAVAGHQILNVNPVLAYVPGMTIWDPVSRRWSSYAVFDSVYIRGRRMSVDDAADVILRDCPAWGVCMIFSGEWAAARARGYDLAFKADEWSLGKESYFVYAPRDVTLSDKH